MGRCLIVNADDLGWSEEVNAGIIEAHLRGVVTSATLMATMPGAEDAVRRLRECPRLGVGIHLTLTAGVPVSGENRVREELAPGGALSGSVVKMLRCARTSKRWREAAEMELAAQVAWAMERGLKPDHLDSHKHIHVIKPFPEMVVRVAERFGIKGVRNTCEYERSPAGHVGLGARARRRLLVFWGKRASRTFAKAGLVQPETIFGVEDTGAPDMERVRAFLAKCKAEKVEWMVHPGNREERPATATRLVESRAAEKKMLTSPELRGMIARSGFELARYEELVK